MSDHTLESNRSKQIRYGYLTGLSQLVRPPSLPKIGLSFNDNSNFVLLGRRSDIVDFCLRHHSTPVELQPTTTLWEIPPGEDRVTLEVCPIRSGNTLGNSSAGSAFAAILVRTPFAPVMVVMRPFDTRRDTKYIVGGGSGGGGSSRTFIVKNGTTLGEIGRRLEQVLLWFPRGFSVSRGANEEGVRMRRRMSLSPTTTHYSPAEPIQSLPMHRYYTEPVHVSGTTLETEAVPAQRSFYRQSLVETSSVTSLPEYSASPRASRSEDENRTTGSHHGDGLPPSYEEIIMAA